MIHYHGLPMTPVLAMLRAMKGRHAMVSFENPAQLPEAVEVCQSVALDNGAFSAWRQEKPYDFAGYVEWCGLWLKHPGVDWAIIPDVIDGDEEANERLLAQWPHGKLGVPVWHLHECLERLQRLCERWPRVALGSSGKWADPGSRAWWERMAQAMRVACDADGMPKTKLHGLRMLDPVIFSHLPLASADSCNVARNIGIDSAWSGTYQPASKVTRAVVMIDRIESHASAHRWCVKSSGVQQNMELLG
jgi:hypothetical protein